MAIYTTKIHNRGIPKPDVVDEIIFIVEDFPDSCFEPNEKHDIYTNVKEELGPWRSIKHRRAVMIEVLVVLAGFESSWNWKAGIDTTNPSSFKNKCNEESGLFQCSGNSKGFDARLKKLMGLMDCKKWIDKTKRDHVFAVEWATILLRNTTEHHGPVKRKEINKWLSRERVALIEEAL
jgi:hypothetical protein